jgi:hypothetical protein
MDLLSHLTLLLTTQPNNYNLQKVQFLVMAVLIGVIAVTSLLIIGLLVTLFKGPAGKGRHAEVSPRHYLRPISIILAVSLLAVLFFRFF